MPRAVAAIVVIALLILQSKVATAQSVDWPQWLGPSRDGISKESGLLQSWPAGGPPRRWLFRGCGAGYGGPAIADGKLFILGTRGDKAQLFALDVDTGDELWAAPLGDVFENDWGDGPRGTPAVDGGQVYALSADGTLICVLAANGREVWRTSMDALGGQCAVLGLCRVGAD